MSSDPTTTPPARADKQRPHPLETAALGHAGAEFPQQDRLTFRDVRASVPPLPRPLSAEEYEDALDEARTAGYHRSLQGLGEKQPQEQGS